MFILYRVWTFSIFFTTLRTLSFLLSMNEVNIKYWFRNFQKKVFIDFLDDLGLFIEEKPICTKKKFPSPAVCRLPRKVWLSTSTLPIQLIVRDFSFCISEWFAPQSILLIFRLREQIPSGHFQVKYWPILMFLDLIWCKILCWAQKSILYGV
jgi:hypothetical protein